MTKDMMTLEQLLSDIEGFFDGSLTDEQEDRLRRELAATVLSHPSIDEAKAIMGFRAPRVRKESRRESRMLWMRTAGIAASIALVVSAGVFLSRTAVDSQNECIAYVGGRQVTDEDAVMAIMMRNLREFNIEVEAAHETIMDDWSEVAEAVDRYESMNNPF